MTLAALIEKIDKAMRVNVAGWTTGHMLLPDEWQSIRDALPVWRPISEAPRDGSWFVIYLPEPLEFEIGRYEPIVTWNYEQVSENLYKRVPITIYEWAGFSNFHLATHWMPLPKPPEET